MLKKTVYIASAIAALSLTVPGLIYADMMSAPTAQITDAPRISGQSQPKHIVELFTSQGCSSCPISNALLTDISQDEDALALTYGVDYWDYLGWKDTFANPSFSDRQHGYSNALGHGRVYTPQMIVNGLMDAPRISREDISGQSPIDAMIDVKILPSGTVKLSQKAQAGANIDWDASATVRLITYSPGTHNVNVGAGENDGRVLQLTNVVKHVSTLGAYTGNQTQLEAGSFDKTLAYAVLVQQGENGLIMGAANYFP